MTEPKSNLFRPGEVPRVDAAAGLVAVLTGVLPRRLAVQGCDIRMTIRDDHGARRYSAFAANTLGGKNLRATGIPTVGPKSPRRILARASPRAFGTPRRSGGGITLGSALRGGHGEALLRRAQVPTRSSEWLIGVEAGGHTRGTLSGRGLP
jgi:hypothetical protein